MQTGARVREGAADLMRIRVPRLVRRRRAEADKGDQVARLEQWKARHPDVQIQNPDYPSGGQLWIARSGSEVLCSEYELRVLLDHLDWLIAQEWPADA
jgi:hypothetical protein